MKEPIHDQDAIDRHRAAEAAEAATTPEAEAPAAKDQARPCPVPVRLGAHWAAAAYRAGCEDEWIDRIEGRYGEGY